MLVGTSGAAGGVWRLILGVFVQNRLAVLGLGLIVFMVLFSFVGPHLYVTNQIQTNLGQVTQRPSGAHPLGTDQLGYDVLGRLMVGGQSSLEVGLAAALLASVVGTAWGAISGYSGKWVDAVMMRIVDSFLAIPPLLLILMLASVVTPTVPVLILVIALISWLATARLVRRVSLSVRTADHVQAATAGGARNIP